MNNYDSIYEGLNNDGYSVGSEGDDINELSDELNAELIERSGSSERVAVYREWATGDTVIVGNSHGPWAVRTI